MNEAPGQSLELGGNLFAPVRRNGNWVVPARLLLRRRLGSTKLDFTEAVIEHPTVDIHLDVKGGSIEIRVPDGASVSLDQVETGAGSVEDHRHGKPKGVGVPHFVISGKVTAGSFEVRGPKRDFRGRTKDTQS